LTLKFKRLVEIVIVHVDAKFHQHLSIFIMRSCKQKKTLATALKNNTAFASAGSINTKDKHTKATQT